MTEPASISSPSAVTTPTARRPSRATRSTSASPRIVRFGRLRAGSRYASFVENRRLSRIVERAAADAGRAGVVIVVGLRIAERPRRGHDGAVEAGLGIGWQPFEADLPLGPNEERQHASPAPARAAEIGRPVVVVGRARLACRSSRSRTSCHRRLGRGGTTTAAGRERGWPRARATGGRRRRAR